jgi:hypothetical protein
LKLRSIATTVVSTVLFTALPVSAVERYVAAGGSFQAALDAALPGDTIVLQAGAQFLGNFRLPKKSGSAWITIRSSDLGMLPPAGSRVNPKHERYMPRVIAPNSGAALTTAKGAHHYRIIGVSFGVVPNVYNWNIVTVGEGTETSLTDLPYEIEFDRVLIRGDRNVGSKRGIGMNGKRTVVVNSWISEIKSLWQDANGILGWNGPGPYRIQNNYIEASSEAIVFGGAIPKIANLVPSDISVLQNYCYKPLSWKIGHPSYAGKAWWVKNAFELKNARRVRVEGNVFENNWAHQQNGFAILFTVRTENGRVPWAVIEDVNFKNNLIRHVSGGVNILGRDGSYGGAVRRIAIRNNLFDDVNSLTWGGTGRLYQMLQPTQYVVYEHNTGIQNSHIMVFDGAAPHTGFVYRNNLSPHNTYGILGNSRASGSATLDYFAPGHVTTKNVMAGGVASRYPAGNYFPASLATVGFINMFSDDYGLSTTSLYRGAATDGKDVGVDMTALEGAIKGVVEGTPTNRLQ